MRKIKLLICLLAIFFSGTLLAQQAAQTDIPVAVTSAFTTKFPDASETKWKKNKSGKYEADFRLAGKKAEAKFTADGKWDSTKKRVEASQLPAAASSYVQQNYASHTIDQVEWKEEADASKNEYEVKLKKDQAETELVFDGAGKFVKKKDKEKKI